MVVRVLALGVMLSGVLLGANVRIIVAIVTAPLRGEDHLAVPRGFVGRFGRCGRNEKSVSQLAGVRAGRRSRLWQWTTRLKVDWCYETDFR